ncbi:hypothetical protein RB195_014157 [Necator americanus]|uniref:Uncharacterized protein n=1 Tax=Necator americanus TaxID=51031 RepID=A0ABR1DYW1_NECAM
MNVAPGLLFVNLAILVSVYYMCLPLPLRNDTTVIIAEDETTPSLSGKTSLLHTSLLENASRFLTMAATKTTANNTSMETVNPTTAKDNAKGSSPTFQKSSSWIKHFVTQPVYLPVNSPQEGRDVIFLLMQVYFAKGRRAFNVSERSAQNVYMVPTILIALATLLATVTLTILLRKARSLEFVRSPAIQYYRTVNDETNSQMTRAKASLSVLAGMKGVYQRGRLKEISDVFTRLGIKSPPQTADEYFASSPAKDKASEQPCIRIKLLTAEEIAREDL